MRDVSVRREQEVSLFEKLFLENKNYKAIQFHGTFCG